MAKPKAYFDFLKYWVFANPEFLICPVNTGPEGILSPSLSNWSFDVWAHNCRLMDKRR
jgi:hypothetical protein